MINYIYFESPDWRTFSCERLPVKPTAKDIFDTGIMLAAKLRMYNLELSALKAKSVKVGNYEILEAIDHPNQNAHTLCFDGQWYVRYDEIIEWSGSVEIKKDVHCDEYHQHTKESCFVKVAILKLPETPIAMEQTKEQDAAHSLIKNECYWIKIEQWKDRDTRIKDKWSIAKWDGESFEELNEMYRIEEVIEIGEQIPSKEERTAEDILDGLEQTDDGYIHYSKVLPAMREYAAQELDAYKTRLKKRITDWNSTSIEEVPTSYSWKDIFELIDTI